MSLVICAVASNIHVSSNIKMKRSNESFHSLEQPVQSAQISKTRPRLDQTMVSPFGGATRFAIDWTTNRPGIE